jgi:hypothetical protein
MAVRFRPTGATLAAVGKAPGTRLWDVTMETRSPAMVTEMVTRGSEWRLENGSLLRAGSERVPVTAAALAPGGALAASDRGAGEPPQAVVAFLAALEQGNSEAVNALLASKVEQPLSSLREAGPEKLRQYYSEFFKDARIESTMFRKDRLSAMTVLRAGRGDLGIWTLKETGQWKLLNLGARPRHE